jgi:hypothetical protein
MIEPFPGDLPSPLANMSDWSWMNYDQFAGFYHAAICHPFRIPSANVNFMLMTEMEILILCKCDNSSNYI